MKEKIVVEINEELEVLFPGYLNNKRTEVSQFAEKIKEGDFEWIRKMGHALKGSGSAYGFEFITNHGAAIESLAPTEDREGLLEKIAELEDFLERVEVVFVPMDD